MGSDEEPIFELDQQEWIGEKVERIEYPEKKADQYLCKFITLKFHCSVSIIRNIMMTLCF